MQGVRDQKVPDLHHLGAEHDIKICVLIPCSDFADCWICMDSSTVHFSNPPCTESIGN